MNTNIKKLARQYGVAESTVSRLKYAGKLDQLDRFKKQLQEKDEANMNKLKGMKKRVKLELTLEAKESFYMPGMIEYIEDSIGGIKILNYKFKDMK